MRGSGCAPPTGGNQTSDCGELADSPQIWHKFYALLAFERSILTRSIGITAYFADAIGCTMRAPTVPVSVPVSVGKCRCLSL